MSFPLSIRILLLICPEGVDVYLHLWQLFLYSEHFILPQLANAELGMFQVKLILGAD